MNLQEQYADNLNQLLWTLKAMQGSGETVDGVKVSMLFNFAKSEINALGQGLQTKEECLDCTPALCCVLPAAIVPAQGLDGSVVRPLRYTVKYQLQPCWWLRQGPEGFKCALFDSGERPYTCTAYLCKSKDTLKEQFLGIKPPEDTEPVEEE